MSLLWHHIHQLELQKILGLVIRKQRLLKKKSMRALAYEADMEYMQLSRIELGKINTTVFQLFKICLALKIDISVIFKELEKDLDFNTYKGKYY